MSSSPSPTEGLVALVVDDEPLACENLRRKLLALDGFAHVHTLTDPVAAVLRLEDDPPDVLFLDVRMPGLSGFDVLAQFPEPSRPFLTVFCTAHDEHAAQAFAAAALDYLVKPVDPTRLAATLARIRRQLGPKAGEPSHALLARARSAGMTGHLTRLVVRFRGGAKVVALDDVLALSSEAHHAVAYTLDDEHVLEPSLAALEPQLDPVQFVRCHRAHLVQLAHVQAVEEDWVVLTGGRRTPLSRRNRRALLSALAQAARSR